MSFVLRSSICVFHRFNHLLTPAKLCKFNAESTASHYQILMINQRSFKRYQRFGHQKGVGDLGLTRMEKIIMIYCCVGFSIVVFDYGSICLTLVPQNSGPNNADTKKTPITENCASVTSNVLNLSVPDT